MASPIFSSSLLSTYSRDNFIKIQENYKSDRYITSIVQLGEETSRRKEYEYGITWYRTYLGMLQTKLNEAVERLTNAYKSHIDRVCAEQARTGGTASILNSIRRAVDYSVDGKTHNAFNYGLVAPYKSYIANFGYNPFFGSKGIDLQNEYNKENTTTRTYYSPPDTMHGYREWGSFFGALNYLWTWDLDRINAAYASGYGDMTEEVLFTENFQSYPVGESASNVLDSTIWTFGGAGSHPNYGWIIGDYNSGTPYGGGWNPAKIPTIYGKALYQETNEDNAFAFVGNDGWTDYSFQAIIGKSNGDNDETRIWFRQQGNNDKNGYYFYVHAGGVGHPGKSGIIKVVNGVETVIASNSWGYDNPGGAGDVGEQHCAIRIEVDGDNIKVFRSNMTSGENDPGTPDTLLFNINDNTFLNGKIGLASCSQASWFDNIEVKELNNPWKNQVNTTALQPNRPFYPPVRIGDRFPVNFHETSIYDVGDINYDNSVGYSIDKSKGEDLYLEVTSVRVGADGRIEPTGFKVVYADGTEPMIIKAIKDFGTDTVDVHVGSDINGYEVMHLNEPGHPAPSVLNFNGTNYPYNPVSNGYNGQPYDAGSGTAIVSNGNWVWTNARRDGGTSGYGDTYYGLMKKKITLHGDPLRWSGCTKTISGSVDDDVHIFVRDSNGVLTPVYQDDHPGANSYSGSINFSNLKKGDNWLEVYATNVVFSGSNGNRGFKLDTTAFDIPVITGYIENEPRYTVDEFGNVFDKFGSGYRYDSIFSQNSNPNKIPQDKNLDGINPGDDDRLYDYAPDITKPKYVASLASNFYYYREVLDQKPQGGQDKAILDDGTTKADSITANDLMPFLAFDGRGSNPNGQVDQAHVVVGNTLYPSWSNVVMSYCEQDPRFYNKEVGDLLYTGYIQWCGFGDGETDYVGDTQLGGNGNADARLLLHFESKDAYGKPLKAQIHRIDLQIDGDPVIGKGYQSSYYSSSDAASDGNVDGYWGSPGVGKTFMPIGLDPVTVPDTEYNFDSGSTTGWTFSDPSKWDVVDLTTIPASCRPTAAASGKVLRQNANATEYAFYGGANWVNYTLTGVVGDAVGTDDDEMRIWFRNNGASDGYFLFINGNQDPAGGQSYGSRVGELVTATPPLNPGEPTIGIAKVQNGVITQFIQTNADLRNHNLCRGNDQFNPGEFYNFKIVCDGNHFKVYIDDTDTANPTFDDTKLAFEFYDNTFSSGGLALSTCGQQMWYDNIKITDVEVQPQWPISINTLPEEDYGVKNINLYIDRDLSQVESAYIKANVLYDMDLNGNGVFDPGETNLIRTYGTTKEEFMMSGPSGIATFNDTTTMTSAGLFSNVNEGDTVFIGPFDSNGNSKYTATVIRKVDNSTLILNTPIPSGNRNFKIGNKYYLYGVGTSHGIIDNDGHGTDMSGTLDNKVTSNFMTLGAGRSGGSSDNEFTNTLKQLIDDPEFQEVLRHDLFRDVFISATYSDAHGDQVVGKLFLDWDRLKRRVKITQASFFAIYRS